MQSKQQPDSFDIMKFLTLENIRRDQEKQAQLRKQQKPIDTLKPKRISFKNKYVNKVKQSLGGISTSIRFHSQPQSQPIIDVEAEKKFRNREAAKQTRQRKKEYIKIVEKEIRTLQDQLQQVNKDLEECKAQIVTANQISQQNIGGSLLSQTAPVVKKLKKFVQQQESIELNADINLAIDSMCYRFALLGRERISRTNKGYNQILRLGITMLQRYVMFCASEGCHLFADQNSNGQQEHWFAEMKSMFGDVLLKQKQKIQGIRGSFVKQKVIMEELQQALLKKKQQIRLLCGQIDELHQDFRRIYTPKQLAKLLIFHDGATYKQQLRFIQKICFEDGEGPQLGDPVKKTKLNQE